VTRHKCDVIIAFSSLTIHQDLNTRPSVFQTPNLNLQELSLSLLALSIYLIQAATTDLSHAVIKPGGLAISYISVRRAWSSHQSQRMVLASNAMGGGN